MKKILILPLLFIVAMLVNSCSTYNQTVNNSFTKLSTDSCMVKQKNVFLFFEGEPVTFKFKRVGLVEAAGYVSNNDKDILDQLKYNAYQNCANAVINITSETVSQTSGGRSKETVSTQLSKIYKGLAIQIESDSLYMSSAFGDWQDDGFVKAHEHKHSGVSLFFTAVLAVAILVAIALVRQ